MREKDLRAEKHGYKMKEQSARSAEAMEREKLKMKQEMEKERMMKEYQHRCRQVTLRKKDRYGNTFEISMDFELLGMMQIGGPSYGQSPYSITED